MKGLFGRWSIWKAGESKSVDKHWTSIGGCLNFFEWFAHMNTNDTYNLTTSKVEWKTLHLMEQLVLEYQLPIELPKSIIGGQNASVWSTRESKVVQITMGAHLMKKFVWSVEHLKRMKEHEKPWTSVGGFARSFNDLHKWYLQRPTVEYEKFHLMKQHVLKYRLPIELPKSIMRGGPMTSLNLLCQ